MANIQKGLAASQIVLFGPIVPLFLGAVRRGAHVREVVGLRRVVSGDSVLLSAARPQARAASTATHIPHA